jgi:hypothetical protein
MTLPNFSEIPSELRQLMNIDEELAAKEAKAQLAGERLQALIAAGIDPDRDARVAKIVAGQDLSVSTNLKEQLVQNLTGYSELKEGRRLLAIQIAAAKQKAGRSLCLLAKPHHDAIMKRVCSLLVELHSAHAELFALKRELIDKEIGIFDGVCALLPDFLDVPTNRSSPMADFCREAVKHKYLRAVPELLL